MEGEFTERTPLHAGGGTPMYVFSPNPGRLYRNRVRHFQCCICAAILAIFVLALVVTVSYSINNDSEDKNGTTPNEEIAQQQLHVLLSRTWPIDDASPEGAWPLPAPSDAQLQTAAAAGATALAARRSLEGAMPELPVDSPSFRHQKAVATSAAANSRAQAGYAALRATQALVKGARVPPGQRGARIAAAWQWDDACAEEDHTLPSGLAVCPAKTGPWRAPDGRCNNLLRPWQGAALRPFRRVLPAQYADGVTAPRSGAGGSTLPSAREVSITVHRPQYRDDAAFSILLAVWGQFIDHDITATALSKRSTDGGAISCCYAAQSSGLKAHPECFPVMLGPEDPFFQQYNVSCMEFVRSAPAPACKFGPREQLNQATSFLDGSVVYGSSAEATAVLRAWVHGRLRMLVTDDGRELLPASKDPDDGCNRAEETAKGRYCFLSGDSRANENLHLTTLHLLLARQHNRLAQALKQRNPSWGDERLFQEARRVVAAQMQHITYTEFVPTLLGSELMEKLALQPREEGYSSDYDPDADPRIGNVFAAAAFRFAHTLLPGLMRMISNTSSEYVELHKVLFNPFALYSAGGEGPALRGALFPGLLRFDPHFSPQVSQHLFQRDSAPSKGPCGLDLVSLNIQRGRDHGLPPYPAWRAHCGLSQPKSFSDLQGVVDDDSLARIAAIYRSVEDIDPYTGMLAELPVPGGMLGPTLTCLLADQFVRLRRGDRYWYETAEKPQAFSPAQLREVRKTSLAQLLCDTSDAVTSIQRWVLRAPTAANPRVPCASLPRPDLDAWTGAPDPSPPTDPAAHVAGAGDGPRALGPGAPPTAPLAPGTALSRPLRLGAAVAAARVSTAAGRAWYAAFPLQLPLPLFDSLSGGGATTPGATTFPHGILWQGSLTPSTTGHLKFVGEYSLPKYFHEDGVTNFTVMWINGDFEFDLEVLWNTSDISTLNVQDSYSSPVYLGARNKYDGLLNETTNELFDPSGEYRGSPSLDIAPVVKKAPIILLGTYSPDGTSFLWSGNVSVIIPDAVPLIPWSKSSYWTEANAEVPMGQMPWVPRTPEVETLPASAGISSALGITVTNGSVQVISNGTSTTWWNGTLPVAIPIPAFNRVIKAASKSSDGKPVKPSYASGLAWNATLQQVDNTTLNIEGNFSVPIFVHGPGALFAIEWKEGSFSIDFALTWNASSIDTLFQNGRKYSSPVFFRASKPSDSVKTTIVAMREAKALGGSPALQFVAATVADDTVPSKAPIILHGNYTPDKTQFLWNGNATVILPAPTGPVLLEMTAKQQANGIAKRTTVAIGANLMGGSITGKATDQMSTNIWNGELPVPIRRPDLLVNGITWKGSLTSSSITEAQLEGSFSTALPGDPNSTFPFILFQGKFSLQLGLLWNASVDGLIPAGAQVFSPIYMRGSAAPDDAEAWFTADEDPSHQRTNAANLQAPADSINVPIILQGAYSSDLSTFWWSGRVIMIFPSPVIPPEDMLKARERLIFTQSQSLNERIRLTSWFGVPWGNEVAAPQGGSPFMRPLRFGATVRSGSIKTTAGSAWSGSLPLKLTLPLFDVIATPGDTTPTVPGTAPAYAHGILWEGTISSNTAGKVSFYGQFSMPRYVHGAGLTNYSIQWINGHFDFDMDVLWNTSDITGLAIQGSYSSPVFLSAEKKSSHIKSESSNSLWNVDSAVSASPSLSPYPLIKKAPIILKGTYTPDGKGFIWSGNISSVIPDVVPVPSWTASSLWAEDNGLIPSLQMAKNFQKPQVEGLSASAVASSAMGIGVSGGNITLVSNGTTSLLWGGTFPLAIPIPAFNRVVKMASKKASPSAATKPKPSYSTGLTWDATLNNIDNITLRVQGVFSVPIFVHGPGAMFAIDWKQGTFNLDFRVLWNSTSFETVFQEGQKYSSPVFFKATKPTDTVNDIIVGLQENSEIEGSAELQFVAAASAEVAALPRAPIIIHGNYTPDKTQFLWNGNATLILPAPAGPKLLQMSLKAQNSAQKVKRVTVGGNVMSGSLVAGAAAAIPSTLWSGEIPVSIRRPDLLSRGVVWKGDISSSATEATLECSFSAKWPSTLGETFPFTLYQGKFSVRLGLLWNASVDNLLPPGTTVYSPIYLHGRTVPPQTDFWFAIEEDLGREMKQTKPPPEAAGAVTVPIVLQGSYSPDLTTFWWSGFVIISLPAPAPKLTENSISNEKIFLTPKKYVYNQSPQVTTREGSAIADLPLFRPLRLGATVMSASITTSAGRAWSGELPLEIPLPLFDSIAGPGDATPSVPGALPVYAHGIVWEGSLYSSSSGYLSFSGKFSMPRYIHGGGLTNFSIQWVNGNFDIGLSVLWNTSDVSSLNIQGSYSSPVYLVARKKYSPLQYVPAATLSDVTDAIKLTPSLGVGPVMKKAPIVLFGTYSPTGKSFIWSGNVTIVIPNAVPVPTWTPGSYFSNLVAGSSLQMASRKEVKAATLPVTPSSSIGMGVSVSRGKVNGITNGTVLSWWDGSFPLVIPSPAFNRVVKATSERKEKLSKDGAAATYGSGLLWDATLEHVDNTTLRVEGNFTFPIYVHGPGAMFAMEWKKGNFSLDFNVLWNVYPIDLAFQNRNKYYSPVYFKATKPADTVQNIIVGLEEANESGGSAELQFLADAAADATALPKAPIILHGNYSLDKTEFFWFGNATIILPTPEVPVMLQANVRLPSDSPIEWGSRTVAAEVIDGSVSASAAGMPTSSVWSGSIPFPIRKPNLLAKGITWKGEFTELSVNETTLEGTFSTSGTSTPGSSPTAYNGKYSLKLSLLWNITLMGLIPPGASVFSPIYLRGTTVPRKANDGAWFSEQDNNPESVSEELSKEQEETSTLRVPIILQGTYSPDLSTFWWTGRMLLAFPPPTPATRSLVQAVGQVKASSVGAVVTSGAVVATDGTTLWDGALPVTLPPTLKAVVWSGSVTPAVGGTVELKGMFISGKTDGEFAFVLTPLWSTPLAGRVAAGVNYTSTVFMRESNAPFPKEVAKGGKARSKVPIVLLGTFSDDKLSFEWSGSVVIAFPDTV